MAYDRLISKIPVPDLLVHRIRAELEDPEQSALLFEAEIRKSLPSHQSAGFNLALLGDLLSVPSPRHEGRGGVGTFERRHHRAEKCLSLTPS